MNSNGELPILDESDAHAASHVDDSCIVPATLGSGGGVRASVRSSAPVAALLLSLTFHATAAALTFWAVRQGMPELRLAAGAGAGTADITMDDSSASLASVQLGDPPDAATQIEPLDTEQTAFSEFPASDLQTSEEDEFSASDVLAASGEPARVGGGLGASSMPLPKTVRRPAAKSPSRDPQRDATGDGPGQLAGDGNAASSSSPSPSAANRPPKYPREALRRRWEGTVLLEVHIAKGGAVADARVASSSGHDVLDTAALEAVRAWRFNAQSGTRLDYDWKGTVPVNFVLKKG